MKTLMLRVCYLGLAVSTILASPGAKEPTTADAQVLDPIADVLPPLKIADADALAEKELPAPLANPTAVADTNAPAKLPIPMQEPTAPPNVQLSPALAEVVKLVQAGVGPDVLMAYITNSTHVFNIDSDAIVYLNDLGVTNTVITALIQHDSSPESAARKASANATQPLPPGVAVTSPATNVYPQPAHSFPPAGQTTYPGDFSTVTDTNAETVVQADTNLPPAVVTAPPAAENVTVNYFYSSLAPYGSWVDVDGYGLCWRPTVAVHDPYWRPYADRGRWLWSDAGWYWYSDYSWGWAPFHYGRWCSYPRLGWVWVPGSVWAPSWVTWRYTDTYCGWAPLPPGCGWRSGIGLTWYGHGVSIGFDFGLGWNCWSYVPVSRFCDWNVRRHFLPEHRLHVVHKTAVHANRISSRNNTIVNNGIEPNTIAKASRTKIPTARIRDGALPADRRVKPERIENTGDSVAVVRPQLPKSPAPTKLARNTATTQNVAPERGAARRATPMNLGNSAQATAPAPKPNRLTPPNANVAATPRPNVNNNPANNPPLSGAARDQANARRHNPVAPPNSGVRNEAPNRPATVQPSTPRPQQTVPNNVQRQPATANPAPRNNPSQAPAVRNPAPPPRNPAPAVRDPAPAVRNPAPVGRNLAPPVQAAPRPVPQGAAPAPRNISPMIPSYAQPQRNIPNAGRSFAPQPSPRAQVPMATPQPSFRPQHATPRVSPPASIRSAPAPSVSRSVPNSGGGRSGGGGGGGGKNRGD